MGQGGWGRGGCRGEARAGPGELNWRRASDRGAWRESREVRATGRRAPGRAGRTMFWGPEGGRTLQGLLAWLGSEKGWRRSPPPQACSAPHLGSRREPGPLAEPWAGHLLAGRPRPVETGWLLGLAARLVLLDGRPRMVLPLG